MRPLRCLIDSMIFDAIAERDETLALVDRLTSARRLELLAAPAGIAQVAATPDPARRRRLQRVRVLVVPPAPAPDDGRGPASRLRGARGVDRDDAAIAAAAAHHGVPLVTEDRALREAVAARLPQVAVWDWRAGLAPRLDALAREHSVPPGWR
jgi:predicted nucleic acid-binding protein